MSARNEAVGRALRTAGAARPPRAPGTGPPGPPPASTRIAAVCLLIAGLAPGSAPPAAAEKGPPLVPQVAGNCYERTVRDADGRMTGHQRIRVRDPVDGPRGIQARIDVVNFKTGGAGGQRLRVDDRFDFRMIGDISEGAQKEEAALQIIGYVGSRSRVALDVLGDTAIYPDGRCRGQRLPPVELDLSARGGLVDLLGGRAEIRITDRACRPAGNAVGSADAYLINGTLQLKIYLLGIPFKRERYTSRHLIDPGRGLVRHRLDNRDGGSQELVLVNQSACTPPWTPVGER